MIADPWYDTSVEKSTRLENVVKSTHLISSENFNLMATKITLPEVYLSKSNKYSSKVISMYKLKAFYILQ